MSRASAQVKFPDGTVRHGIYNGTVDVYWPYLFETSEEAWAAWDEYYTSKPMSDKKWAHRVMHEQVDGPFYDVEIADSYGGGDGYYGKATKNVIVSATLVDHMTRIKREKKGGWLPDWWVKE